MKRTCKRLLIIALTLALLAVPVNALAAGGGGYAPEEGNCGSRAYTLFSRYLSDMLISRGTDAGDGEKSCGRLDLLYSLFYNRAPNGCGANDTYGNADSGHGGTSALPGGSANQQRPSVPTPGGAGNTRSAYAAEVVELVNAERAARGLAPLTADADLTAAATVRAGEVIAQFSHTRPDGSSCFTALDATGARYRMAGENIAIGQKTPAEVVSAWMNSEGHRANILNAQYSRIGVACTESSGAYSGYAWAQFFAD